MSTAIWMRPGWQRRPDAEWYGARLRKIFKPAGAGFWIRRGAPLGLGLHALLQLGRALGRAWWVRVFRVWWSRR